MGGAGVITGCGWAGAVTAEVRVALAGEALVHQGACS